MLSNLHEDVQLKIKFFAGDGLVGIFDFLKNRKPTSDEPKSTEYYETISREIGPLEDVMVGFSSALPGIKNVDDRIEVLKSLIQSYYDLRSKCVSLGEDYQKYFSKMWEHIHNSKCNDFCFVDRYEQELEELERNRNIIFAEQELHAKESENLKSRVLEILNQNRETTQTEIYKKFDPVVQKDIQEILYFLAKDGIIKREKYKTTYIIKLKKWNNNEMS